MDIAVAIIRILLGGMMAGISLALIFRTPARMIELRLERYTVPLLIFGSLIASLIGLHTAFLFGGGAGFGTGLLGLLLVNAAPDLYEDVGKFRRWLRK